MITRTSQPASGAMLISEMKEFASFPKATQRYIRRSLDVAYGRRDPIECWARDEGEAASIRAQARLYKQLDHLRLQVPDDSGLDMIEPFIGMLITIIRVRPWPGPAAEFRRLPLPLRAADRRVRRGRGCRRPSAPPRRFRTFTRIAAGSCSSRSAKAPRPRRAGRAASRCSGRSGSRRSTSRPRPRHRSGALGRLHRRKDLRQLPKAVLGIPVVDEDHAGRFIGARGGSRGRRPARRRDAYACACRAPCR